MIDDTEGSTKPGKHSLMSEPGALQSGTAEAGWARDDALVLCPCCTPRPFFQDPGGPKTAFCILGSDKILQQWARKRAESHKTIRRANHRRRPWHFVELLRRADGRLGSLGARDGEGKIVFRSYDDFGGHGPLSSAGGGMPWMMATEGMVDDERTGQGSAQCVRWLPGCGNLLSPGGWQGLRRASSLRGMPVTNNDGNLLPRLRTPVPQAIDRQYLRLSRN